MELTNEQRDRVFALYLGAKVKVQFRSTDTDTGKVVTVDLQKQLLGIDTGTLILTGSIQGSNPKLQLRRLEDITDEEAVEITKMYFADDIGIPAENAKDFVERYFVKHYKYGNSSMMEGFHLYQYLIQQSFAVPLFIAPGHPSNGQTAVDLQLAEYINPTAVGENGK